MDSEHVTDDDLDLGDQLFQVKQHTLEADRVRGQITDVENRESVIVVRFDILTTGEEGSARFEKPATWTTTNGFVRLVEWCGYNHASAMQLEGEEVPLRNTSDGDGWSAAAWEIDIDRLPGEGLFDHSAYYAGVVRGVIGSVIGAGAILGGDVLRAFLSAEFAVPGLVAGVVAAVPVVIVFYAIVWWLWYRESDDDRRTMTWSEMGQEEIVDGPF